MYRLHFRVAMLSADSISHSLAKTLNTDLSVGAELLEQDTVTQLWNLDTADGPPLFSCFKTESIIKYHHSSTSTGIKSTLYSGPTLI